MADAHGSGPCELALMRVQVPFPALLFDGKPIGEVSHFVFIDTIIKGKYVFDKAGTRKRGGRPDLRQLFRASRRKRKKRGSKL